MNSISRRAFLGFLAASPALTPASRAFAQFASDSPDDLLALRADQLFNLMEFEPVAKAKLRDSHYIYTAMGVDDGETVIRNNRAYDNIQLRPRRLVDVRNIDTKVELFGTTYASPISIQPCGTHKMYHPDGELAVARAAASRNTLQILSTVSTTSVEDVSAARGIPVWYQLYATEDWRITEALVRRAEQAGCPAIALTVDLPNSNREEIERFNRSTNSTCLPCHTPGVAGDFAHKPMFDGLDLANIRNPLAPQLNWAFVDRLKNLTSTPILLKGIVTHEDASLAVEHGVDGIVVSNHGGRAIESQRGTIESLPEVVRAVGGKIPVMVDGGVRRGTDVFKALASGAAAVGIGRPYLWGLSAFGQEGVERVLDIINRELQITMQQLGTPSLKDISANHIARREG